MNSVLTRETNQNSNEVVINPIGIDEFLNRIGLPRQKPPATLVELRDLLNLMELEELWDYPMVELPYVMENDIKTVPVTDGSEVRLFQFENEGVKETNVDPNWSQKNDSQYNQPKYMPFRAQKKIEELHLVPNEVL